MQPTTIRAERSHDHARQEVRGAPAASQRQATISMCEGRRQKLVKATWMLGGRGQMSTTTEPGYYLTCYFKQETTGIPPGVFFD